MKAALAPPALKDGLALAIARRITRRAALQGLDGVWVSGLPQACEALRRGPLLLAANHVSWWDSMLLVQLDLALQADGFVLMDAANLEKLPFMRWLGAIPLDRSSGSRSRAGLAAGATLLDRPGRCLWIFPQGRQRPAHLRPLDLKPGLSLLYRVAGLPILPVSISYLFRERAQPAAFIRFGAPLRPEGDPLPAVEAALIDGLEEADRCVVQGLQTFEPLLCAPPGRSEDGLGTRLLAAWASWAHRRRGV
jgi:1-acyl-sn-glycerol-3-phosphate acyltransferase